MKYVQGPMTTAIIAPSQTMDSLCLLSLSSPLAPTHRLEWLLVCSRWWDKLCVSSIYLLLCFHEAFFIPDEIILIVGISFHLTSNSLCTEIRRMSTSHFVCYFVFFFSCSIPTTNSHYFSPQFVFVLTILQKRIELRHMFVSIMLHFNFTISVLLVKCSL